MKPLKSSLFRVVIGSIIAVFVALLTVWSTMIVGHFRSVSNGGNVNPSPAVTPLALDTYYKLFDEQK